MSKIQMVDLHGQYNKIKEEVDAEIQKVLDTAAFINGPKVGEFAQHLATYTGAGYVIPCANGTDALQIALMGLDLKPGDEVIVPAFTYVATAEVIGLLGLTPVLVDVDSQTFNVTAAHLKKGITAKTKAIVPVHLFGQSCDMAPILELAKEHNLYVVEDNAQAIGAVYTFPNGKKAQTGTMGHIGCTSFFPSKNLGCYGDGGAMMTNDPELAARLKMIANHGQKVKYHHSVIGCNSRLDTLQAAVLDVKLKYLDNYSQARYRAAQYYTGQLARISGIILPKEVENSTHVYHQYTLRVQDGKRDALKKYLEEAGIPAMIYYPLPLQEQEAFQQIAKLGESLDTAMELAYSVLSLPIHTELKTEEQDYIIIKIKAFYHV
ncbi:MAG: DegT/DnrJ/EryC1/StrS family aminotransferase [Bacteroidales bacterium]